MALGLFPHHPLILTWFSSLALRLSAYLGLSVIELEMYKVELTGVWVDSFISMKSL
jgi:hypothetical protein